MTAGAIVGLIALNVFVAFVGNAVLFALCGWRSWLEAGSLLGLGYMLGVAALGSVWVVQLVLGIDLTLTTILGSGVAVAAAGVIVGMRRGHTLPAPRFGHVTLPKVAPLSVLLCALTVLYFEGLFRAGRLAGLYEFDGWFFWIPKAKAIYWFGTLDPGFLRGLPNSAYPPLVPVLEAASFHFMRADDVVTLHLQFWFLLVGFVWAVVGLLTPRVPPLLVWVSLLMMLVTPHMLGSGLRPEGDLTLDELFALAVLLVALWLLERSDWMLWGASLLLAGVMLTKREGYMFAACLLFAAAIVTVRQRGAWPKLFGSILAAVAFTVPWRIFVALHDLRSGETELGGIASNVDRGWPSLRLAVSTLLDFNSWLLVIPLVLVAIVLAIMGTERLLGTFALGLIVACTLGLTWSTWAFSDLPITKSPAVNPIVRVSGGVVLAAAVLTPLLLTGVIRERRKPSFASLHS